MLNVLLDLFHNALISTNFNLVAVFEYLYGNKMIR